MPRTLSEGYSIMDEYQNRSFWPNILNLMSSVDTSMVGVLTEEEKQINEALEKIKPAAEKLLFDKQIGFAYQIDVPIQDVGEYELILTLRLKE